MPDFFSRDFYEATGVTADFAVSFPYLLESHVSVGLFDGASIATQEVGEDFMWSNAQTIHFLNGNPSGVTVIIARDTPIDSPITTFQTSLPGQTQLNIAVTQLLYSEQERADKLAFVTLDNEALLNAAGADFTTLLINTAPLVEQAQSYAEQVIAIKEEIEGLLLPLGLTQTFATRALLKANAVTSFGAAILTEGFSDTYRGRSGTFYWDGSVPWSQAQYDPQEGWYLFPVNGQPGAWVRDIREGTWANHAGLLAGTGKTSQVQASNRDAIQAAIDVIIYGGRKAGNPRIPGGTFEFSGTIHIGYGDTTHSLRLQGTAPVYTTVRGSGTLLIHIDPSFTHQGINIAGARAGAGVSDVALQGAAMAAIQTFAFTYYTPVGTGNPNYVTKSAWNTAAGGDRQHSPYAAITVDAFQGSTPGTKPADPYPDIAYPSFVSQAQYGANQVSSAMTFQGLDIQGWNTGYANKPSDASGNADFPSFERCAIAFCVWGWSIGEGQCRNFATSNCQSAFVYASFTNSTHGRQAGRFGGVHKDFSGGAAALIWDLTNTSVLLSPMWLNPYFEVIWAMGPVAGNTAVEGNMQIIGGAIECSLDTVYGPPSQHLRTGTSGKIIFDGVQFGFHQMFLVVGGSNVELRGDCIMYPTLALASSITAPYLRYSYGASAGGFMSPLGGPIHAQSIRFKPCNLSTGNLSVSVPLGDLYPASVWGRNYSMPIWQGRLGSYSYNDNLFLGPRERTQPFAHSWPKSSAFASVVRVGRTMTCVFNSLTDTDAFYYGCLPGDLWQDVDTQTLWIVKSRTTTTLVLEQQTNYKAIDSTPWDAISDNTGSFFSISCRVYSVLYPTLGVFTAGSPTITNAARPDGSATHISEIQDGDGCIDGYFRLGCIPLASSFVATSGVSTGAKTITLTGNATTLVQVASRQTVNDWVRTAIANVP